MWPNFRPQTPHFEWSSATQMRLYRPHCSCGPVISEAAVTPEVVELFRAKPACTGQQLEMDRTIVPLPLRSTRRICLMQSREAVGGERPSQCSEQHSDSYGSRRGCLQWVLQPMTSQSISCTAALSLFMH